MEKPNITLLRKIYHGMRQSKAKFLTAEMLSKEIGVVPEKIQEACAMFNPLTTIDFGFDLKTLMPDFEAHFATLAQVPKTAKPRITKKETAPYNSVVDFIYEKMTFGGIVDKTLVLKDGDLRMIKRLANDELKARRLQNKAK